MLSELRSLVADIALGRRLVEHDWLNPITPLCRSAPAMPKLVNVVRGLVGGLPEQ
jgi:hypothetical protein